MNFQKLYRQYKQQVEHQLSQFVDRREPRSLYEPIRYVLRAGGKRVRPVLTLLACGAVGGRAAHALDAAVAIELLHSFTLVHDDIMDNADTRRGFKTVHEKWNHNVAILVGDEMVAMAYRSLTKTNHPRMTEIVETFTKAFNEVCEGQGLDEEFEQRRRVGIQEYMRMIKKKTAAMISAATTIGGIIGGGTSREIKALRAYGEHLGRAFQIQDDILDIIADTKSFGKTIGSDLKQGKKTYLLLRGIECTGGKEKALLQRVMQRDAAMLTLREKISRREVQMVREIFVRCGVIGDARSVVRRSTRRAQQALSSLPSRPKTIGANRAKDMLVWLADELLERTI